MDGNLYALEKIAAQRLLDLRSARAHAALLASAWSPRPGLGTALGVVLIRAGEWLAGGAAAGRKAGVRVAR
jgi:hypothetical protein